MSDDDDKVVSLLEERERRLTSKENKADEIKEELPPWFMMDDEEDNNNFFIPIEDNPFLLMSESIHYVEKAEKRIRRLHNATVRMNRAMMTMLFIGLIMTLANFILLFSMAI